MVSDGDDEDTAGLLWFVYSILIRLKIDSIKYNNASQRPRSDSQWMNENIVQSAEEEEWIGG